MARSRDHETTLMLGDLEVLVTYQYEPGEPMTREHPGCGPVVELLAVHYEGGEIPFTSISDAQQDAWIEKICEEVDAAERDDEDQRDDEWPE